MRVLSFSAALVMVEVEAVDGVLCLQAGERKRRSMERPLAGFEFEIDERFQGLREAEILGGRRQSDI